jgi:hypothetical protein
MRSRRDSGASLTRAPAAPAAYATRGRRSTWILSGIDAGAVTAAEAIERVLGAQIALRNGRRLEAMRSSRLPAVKTLADFDFAFQPSLKREQIESLHELGFVERKENWSSSGRRASARATWSRIHLESVLISPRLGRLREDCQWNRLWNRLGGEVGHSCPWSAAGPYETSNIYAISPHSERSARRMGFRGSPVQIRPSRLS